MEVKDFGTSIRFADGYMKIAELQFTPDFGRVLVINPRCLVNPFQRRYAGIESIKPEHRRCFERITKRWQIDRYAVRR